MYREINEKLYFSDLIGVIQLPFSETVIPSKTPPEPITL